MNSTSNSNETYRLSGAETRLSMNRVVLGWAFGAVFIQIATGAVYASFARQLGASEAVFGFLSGVNPLLGFLQIPAARMLEGRFKARSMMLWAGMFSRTLWVLAALLPFFHLYFPALVPREAMLPTFIACVLLSGVGQAFTGPSFMTWMSELVPDRVGPSFWARRAQVGTFAAIFAVVVGGFIADQAGTIKEWSAGEFPPLLTYSVLLAIASVCGVLDIAMFIGVKEKPAAKALSAACDKEIAPFFASFREALRERAVRNYLIFIAVSMMGFASTGPLLWLFCLEWLEWDKTQTGLLLTICPLLGMAVSAKWWGIIAKAHGTRPLMRFASLGLVLVPIGWFFALPTSQIGLGVMLFVSGILVMPYEISNFHFMTRAAPHLPRPTLTALFSICAGTSFALTSWGAGALAGQFQGFHLEIYGFSLINYHLIFVFSFVVRLVNALAIAPRLENQTPSTTREAMNEISENLAESLRISRFRI